MRTWQRVALASSVASLVPLAGVWGAEIIGLWLSEDKEAVIDVRAYDGELRGRIVWLEPPPDKQAEELRDVHNKDESRRDQKILGMFILWGFQEKSEEGLKWSGGWIYDPKNGKTYKCKLALKGAERLDIRGYVGISVFGRTTHWTRITDDELDARSTPEPPPEPSELLPEP